MRSRRRRFSFSKLRPRLTGFDTLAEIFRAHLDETRHQQAVIEDRLRAHDSGPSRFQSTAMRVGGLNIGAFFGAQPDTPAKLAGFAFAFEHLELPLTSYCRERRNGQATRTRPRPPSASWLGRSSG